METRTLQPAAADAGKRVDAWLAGQLEDLTRSAAQRLLEEGRVTLDGAPLAKRYKLTGSEILAVSLPDPEPISAVPQNIPLDVVFEDGDVIVVNKPKGLVVHPAPGHPDGTLVNALLYHCGGSLSGIGGALRPGIVHRIDRDTSGLILAAKNDFAHLRLAAQLQDHSLARTYECIALGRFQEDAGTVDAPIGRHPADRKKMAVVSSGRPAVTHWEVLARFSARPGPGGMQGGTCAHLRCRLETGRTHQIRVHLAHLGHPILGDTVYGAKQPIPGLQGQCLHAVGLRFLHPRTGEAVELRCPLPEEFQAQLDKLARRSGAL
ncbi:RluA family pseudouridine synthase [uncultured Oscillibacter sp.]|uniref:RluA family pseudouridine synthase n=1 Tax=uncultured Oscillibacter sp. TaxID=876091 RepID=UPI002637A272|nr:RluA family pseudouridine synthase [uncultured Oscillibacter sp.]